MKVGALRDLGLVVDSLLRPASGTDLRSSIPPWSRILLALCASGILYGLVMGAYAGHPLQALYSASKVPLLLCCTTLLCLPNFFVLNTALGLRADFGDALRGILVAQAALSLALASLAPFTALLYVSGISYRGALLANGLMFAIGAAAGQMSLNRCYAVLRVRDRRHDLARRAWLLLYSLIAIQLAWMLRPFIGSPDLPSQFFREEPFDNAYVVVGRIVYEWLGGL